MRPVCKTCGINPRAINYKKGEKVYYRSVCESCLALGKKGTPSWYEAGYRIKDACEDCGIQSPHQEIYKVVYLDKNPVNTQFSNLKTLCSNCLIIHDKSAKQSVDTE